MLLENLKYAKINFHKDEMKNETETTYMTDLNNGVQVHILKAETIGYIIENAEKFYVAFITDFSDIVSTLCTKLLAQWSLSYKRDKFNEYT